MIAAARTGTSSPLVFAPLALAAAVACSDESPPRARCVPTLNPPVFAFGAIDVGRTTERSFELTNRGDGPCTVTAITTGSPYVEVWSPTLPATIAPAEALAMTVRVAHVVDLDTEVVLRVAHAEGDVIRLPISSGVTRTAPSAHVAPASVALTSAVGCVRGPRTITIRAIGDHPVSLEPPALRGAASAFTLTPSWSSATELAPGESASVDVRFLPEEEGTVRADLTLTWWNGRGTTEHAVVELSGTGRAPERITDVFHQLDAPKADLLFVVDDGPSMADDVDALLANLRSFREHTVRQHLDLRIGATTADTSSAGGALLPRGAPLVLDEAAPWSAWEALLSVGTSGSTTSRGLDAMTRVLTSTPSFHRSDAYLSVLLISDGDDRSAGSVEELVAPLRALGARASISAVTGPAGGCTAPSGSAEDGARYRTAASLTGGVFISICDREWVILENLATTTFGLKAAFSLSADPRPESIEVFVDGVRVPATAPDGTVAWSYRPEVRQVAFAPSAVPDLGATIEIAFDRTCP